MNTVKFEAANKPLMVAHRGSCSLEIENTAAAFVAAANRSYFAVECDVMKTVDGKYIVCHNKDTAYVAGDRLTIAESSFDTLRSLKLFNLTQSGKVKDRNDLRLATMEAFTRSPSMACMELRSATRMGSPPSLGTKVFLPFDLRWKTPSIT